MGLGGLAPTVDIGRLLFGKRATTVAIQVTGKGGFEKSQQLSITRTQPCGSMDDNFVGGARI